MQSLQGDAFFVAFAAHQERPRLMTLLLTLPIPVLLAGAFIYGWPVVQRPGVPGGVPGGVPAFLHQMTHLCLAGLAGALVAFLVIVLLGGGSADGEVIAYATRFLCPPTAAIAMVLDLINQSWRGSHRLPARGNDSPARDEPPQADGFSIAPW